MLCGVLTSYAWAMCRSYIRACADHYLNRALINRDDFDAACRHFGLEHYLVDVSHSDVLAALEERRARGVPPTDRHAPYAMMWEDRETIDATLDAYGRRVAEARFAAGAPRAAGTRQCEAQHPHDMAEQA